MFLHLNQKMEKNKYWKKRMVDKTDQCLTAIRPKILEIQKMAKHIEMEDKEMNKKIDDIFNNFGVLFSIIGKAKVGDKNG